MKKRKIVIALGGNAILSDDASSEAQRAAIATTAEYLVALVERGDELIISHGNGPQVGNLLLQQQATDSKENPAMPLDTCVAMTQGSIGYWLQNALSSALQKRGMKKDVVTLVTQVLVDKDDPAFANPSKPIGPFLSKQEAADAQSTSDEQYIEDSGRGWRRVVASPKPVGIREYQVINHLVEQGVVTISVGGGGIPVMSDTLVGVEAVVDKDFASQKLAELVQADLLVILTGVDNVYINFNQPNQLMLESVRVRELERYKKEGHFAAGSMLPKVEAAIAFVTNYPKGKAIITSLENISDLVDGEIGTVVSH